jgi:hypothetical protein
VEGVVPSAISAVVSLVLGVFLWIRVGHPLMHKLLRHTYTDLEDLSEDSWYFIFVGLEVSATGILMVLNLAKIISEFT